MNNGQTYQWDEAKAQANLAKHGVAFEAIYGFDWETAMVMVDDRNDYGEDRYIAIGFIIDRLHVAIVTPRGDDLRVISLRKANRAEMKRYAENF